MRLCLLVALALLGLGAGAGEAQEAATELTGSVVDSNTTAPLEGVRVTAVEAGAFSGPGADLPRQTSGADGSFRFPALPPGRYELRFEKEGYRASSLADVQVDAGRPNAVEFQLPPLPPAEPELSDVEEFVVIASPAEQILAASRFESDQLLNTLSADDFSKLAVSDVADALKFVPGVNVVEGQFAVIRGLEDRYSSTLFNSAIVPSPDPDRQSVQLDLFPSDVVSNLAVSKTFGPELPSNSSGGSINILTNEYPEEFTFKLSTGTGLNDNAWDDFLEYVDGSAVGKEEDVPLEQDFGASLGGRTTFLGREIRFKAAGAWETDYSTEEGTQETREPRQAERRGEDVLVPGDLSLGELNLSGGRFDYTESEYEQRASGYGGFGFDLDEAGNHKIDGSFFYTDKRDETVESRDDGFLPGFDYSELGRIQGEGEEVLSRDFECCATLTTFLRSVRGSPNDGAERGPLWYTSFFASQSFERERTLLISQVNGDHSFEDELDGLSIRWATNYAETNQNETSQGLRYFFEPVDVDQIPTSFPTSPEDLGPGSYAANGGIFSSRNEIYEDQGFARLDLDYEFEASEAVAVKLSAGAWYEDASRDVKSSFLESPTVGGRSQFAITAPDPLTLGESIQDQLDPGGGLRETRNDSSREVEAWYLGSKTTLFEDIDLLAGFRVEDLLIESNNDPFLEDEVALDGTPAIFPTKYLFFDRLDNPARNEVVAAPPEGTTFNDQILGIGVPVDPATGLVDLVDEDQIRSFVNGRIDEEKFLPSFGLAYRPLEGLAIRGAYSQTVARPSFREMGFYVSVEPGSDDLVVGNPQLGLSDVESWDARVEYVWGDRGDLVALSVFKKTIDDPIESIVVRNPLNLDGSSSALFRTFFNNENTADLRGLEIEGRKSLGFLGPEWLEYLSLGGNFTYIDAEVDRSEVERIRSESFFGVPAGRPERFKSLEKSRRLFGQPEWIANADVTFDHPDWGTKASLVLFSISDVLDAAGSAAIAPNGDVVSFTPDRYIDSFYQLDLVLSQKFRVDFLRGDLTLKFTAKNLTDSRRRIIYDIEQTRTEIAERSYRAGRDFSLSLTYSF
jgi:outer membrane receptor protein involved in Fe transport